MGFPSDQKLSAVPLKNLGHYTGSAQNVGVLALSQGATWLDIDAGDLATLTGTAISGTSFAWVSVINTHATQVLYVLLRKDAAAGTATTAAIPVPAGTSIRQICMNANDGAAVTGVSVQGSGASTTGAITIGVV